MRGARVIPVPESPAEAAARWLVRLHAEDCTPDERAEAESWLAASPLHRAAFDECQALWAMPRQLGHHADMFAKLKARADAVHRVPTRPRSSPWHFALAAGIVGVIAAGLLFYQNSRNEVAPPAYVSTPEPRTLALDDGSLVTLSPHTEISSKMTENERRVVMRGGEAFFDVRKDATRPFVVRVGNSEVRVVGTQFNIRERAGELEVVVREGRVNVVPDSRVGPSESVPRVELTAGGRLTVNTADNQVNVASVDAERLTAWRTGMIRFDAIPLEDVIADVNRYTEKPLVIADDRLRRLPISGRFRVGDTDAVVFLLRERFDVTSDVEASRIVLR